MTLEKSEKRLRILDKCLNSAVGKKNKKCMNPSFCFQRLYSGLCVGANTNSSLCPCRCVLGNTTILAEFASEEEISRFFAQGQSLATPSSGWQAIGSSQSRMDQSHPFPSRASEPNQWNSGDLHRSSLWGGSNYSSSLWGNPSATEPGRISSPSPISSFLPVDHLTGGGDSM